MRYRQQFMLMLLEREESYGMAARRGEFPTPREVLQSADALVQEKDPLRGFVSFITENKIAVITGDMKDRVKAADFLPHFNSWADSQQGDSFRVWGQDQLRDCIKRVQIQGISRENSNGQPVIKGMCWTDKKRFGAQLHSLLVADISSNKGRDF